MDESAALKRKLDPLYAGPPEDFVAARDDLAKELKAGGDADAAKAVKKLRRPSVAAALLNRVALGHPKDVKAFAKAVASLRKASGREGLKKSAAAQREAASKLVELAEEEGGEGAALDRVAETLQAAAADEEVEDLVVRGRLEKEQRAASLGFGLDVSDPEDDDDPAPARATKTAKAPKGPTAAERKREQQAEKRREQARKREQRKVEKARKALEAAVTDQQRATEAVDDAAEALAEAKRDLAEAKEAAKEAESTVRGAKQELRDRERELADLD